MRYKRTNWVGKVSLHPFVILAVILTLVSAPAPAAAQEPAERLESIIESLESMLTSMALSNQLNQNETSRIKAELASIYQELESLKTQLAELGGANEEPIEPVNEEGWAPYENATVESWPDGVEFTGWSLDAGIELGWGEYGELLIDITNSYYGAQWSIRDAYSGGVEVNVEARREGDVVVFVSDREGNHEFKLENGGLGRIYYRKTSLVTPPQSTGNPDADYNEWSSNYMSLVDSGQLEDSPAMQWFINQTRTRSYESDGLRDLGNLVQSLSGDPQAETTIGMFVHYIGDKRNKTPIPDPRADPEGFVQIVKLAFILQQTDALFRIEQAR